MTFDEMYSIQVSDSLSKNFYQVYCELDFNRMMKQIKAEREYLINELVDMNYYSVLERSGCLSQDIEDADEIKKVIQFEILEELQIKYDEFIAKYKENK